MDSKRSLNKICEELQCLQRFRVVNLKSRIMIENRLVATIATYSGYNAGQEEKERKKRFDMARALIKEIKSGQEHELEPLVTSSLLGSEGFDRVVNDLNASMEELAKKLPVADWINLPEQRGFALPSLARIIGESGNLDSYVAPGKLWRRMGCAPFTSKNKTLMGATWARGTEGKLSAEEWTEYGYSRRRRSVVYQATDPLVKLNKSIYRTTYDKSKKRAAENHKDWKPIRCELHARLLMGKLLLKRLWIEWNPDMVRPEEEIDYPKKGALVTA